MKKLFLAALAASIVGFSGGANAATCTAAVALGVTPNQGCHVGTTGVGGSGNDSESILDGETLFGETNWTQIAKDNDLNGTDSGDAAALTVTGSLISGTLDIADFVFSTYAKVAVVLKSGGGNATPDFWVAYDVADINSVYSYTSIFLNNNNSNQKNLSHISLYGTGVGPGGGTIPLPAAGWLLVAGLGGLVAVGRKKKS